MSPTAVLSTHLCIAHLILWISVNQTLLKKSVTPTLTCCWLVLSCNLASKQRGPRDLVGENQWRHCVPHPHLVFTVATSLTPFSSGSTFSLLVYLLSLQSQNTSFYPGHPLPISSVLKLLLFHQHSCMTGQYFYIPPLHPILASACCI